MKALNSILVIIMLFTITGCTSLQDNYDPKVQSARMIEKSLKKAKEDALIEAKVMLKEDKDFILISDGELCTFEEEQPRVKKIEMGVPIEEIFTGEYTKDKQHYASKLPVGTKVYIVTKNHMEYRYAEVSNGTDKIYKCKDLAG